MLQKINDIVAQIRVLIDDVKKLPIIALFIRPIIALIISVTVIFAAVSSALQLPSAITGICRDGRDYWLIQAITTRICGGQTIAIPQFRQPTLFIYSPSNSDLQDFYDRLTVRLQNAGVQVVSDKPSAGSIVEIRDLTATQPEQPSGEIWIWKTTASVKIIVHTKGNEVRLFTAPGEANSPAGSIINARNQLADKAAKFVLSK